MNCPFCGSGQHRVLDSRPRGNERLRVRECLACGKRFCTVERWSKEETGRIRCGTCHWYDEFSGVCCNGDSPHCADFTDDDHLCPLWAEGPPWKKTERKETT